MFNKVNAPVIGVIENISFFNIKGKLTGYRDDIEIFINGIAYDDKDPDNAEPHFEPKHGYWGPHIF